LMTGGERGGLEEALGMMRGFCRIGRGSVDRVLVARIACLLEKGRRLLVRQRDQELCEMMGREKSLAKKEETMEETHTDRVGETTDAHTHNQDQDPGLQDETAEGIDITRTGGGREVRQRIWTVMIAISGGELTLDSHCL
jgi:hypothetical protein